LTADAYSRFIGAQGLADSIRFRNNAHFVGSDAAMPTVPAST
jgi:hypothetical protein